MVSPFMNSGDPITNTGWLDWYFTTPCDVHFMQGCGPFDLAPLDTQRIVYAIIVGHDSSRFSSILDLRETTIYVKDAFHANFNLEVETEPDGIGFFLFHQNYPNPFNSTTIIEFFMAEPSAVSLKIYNELGQEIAELINKNLAAGPYSILWEGKNSAGQFVGSGLYFAKLEKGDQTKTIKLMLIR